MNTTTEILPEGFSFIPNASCPMPREYAVELDASVPTDGENGFSVITENGDTIDANLPTAREALEVAIDEREVSTDRLLEALPFTVFALLCAAGTLFGILHRIFA